MNDMRRVGAIPFLAVLAVAGVGRAGPAVGRPGAPPNEVQVTEIDLHLPGYSDDDGDSRGKVELSGMAWCDGDLILLPQSPRDLAVRVKKDLDYALYAISREDLEEYLKEENGEPAPLTPRVIELVVDDPESESCRRAGYEAIAFRGNEVWVTVECGVEPDDMHGHLVRGELADDAVTLDWSSQRRLEPRARLDNTAHEAVVLVDGDVLTLYEAQAKATECASAWRKAEEASALEEDAVSVAEESRAVAAEAEAAAEEAKAAAEAANVIAKEARARAEEARAEAARARAEAAEAEAAAWEVGVKPSDEVAEEQARAARVAADQAREEEKSASENAESARGSAGQARRRARDARERAKAAFARAQAAREGTRSAGWSRASLVRVEASRGSGAERFCANGHSVGELKMPEVPFRITYATDVDEEGRFWVVNYQFHCREDGKPGDVHLDGPDHLADHYDIASGSRRDTTYCSVERLVELKLNEGAIEWGDSRPVVLPPHESPRNWEGVVRHGAGFLLVTDQFPRTILAYVEGR